MTRFAARHDLVMIYRLLCILEKRRLPADDFRIIYSNTIHDRRYACLVYPNEKDEAIGYLTVRFEKQLHHCATVAEILEFVVDPAQRNEGIGRQMLDACCQLARAHGAAHIEVPTNKLRADAHRFYEREGFMHTHVRYYKNLEGDTPVDTHIGL